MIIGVRPEVIKMAPVVHRLRETTFEIRLCDTNQHTDLKQPMLDFFKIVPDYRLDPLPGDRDLATLTAHLLKQLRAVIQDFQPDLILVQGDTTSAMVGALAGFYNRIRVGHVEAGLRTYDKQAPFPEEINRRIITHIADLHFAPTPAAADNLQREGVLMDQIFVTGNTVVDALHWATAKIGQNEPASIQALREQIAPFQARYNQMLLLTLHRRENLLQHSQEIAAALQDILQQENCFALLPVHPSPLAHQWAERLGRTLPNVLLTPALPYEAFIWAMRCCDLILTDSGGIQEEAPTMGKPVVVLRAKTERLEAQIAGFVRQVSVKQQDIVHAARQLLQAAPEPTTLGDNPFGRGDSALQIVQIIERYFQN